MTTCSKLLEARLLADRARFVTALRVAKGALIMCSPCASPECAVEQREWLDDAVRAIDRCLDGPSKVLRAALTQPASDAGAEPSSQTARPDAAMRCEYCAGTGEHFGKDGPAPCPYCDGTGELAQDGEEGGAA